jgi:uncharacterized protein YkwD
MRLFSLISCLLLVFSLSVRAQVDCALERELSRAAQVLLAQKGINAEKIIETVRAEGSDVVSVRALWQRHGDQHRADQWIQTFQSQSDPPLVCGLASASDVSLLIAAGRAGGLKPISAKNRKIYGWLAKGFAKPRLVFVDSNGLIIETAITPGTLNSGIDTPARLVNPIRVQLVATGKGGPLPVAERIIGRLDINGRPGKQINRMADLSPSETNPIQHLNIIRQTWMVPPVRENNLLAQVAARHARTICQTGRIVHEPTAGDTPMSRTAAAGIQARGIGEALAHGDNLHAAMNALQKSPSHLMTMVDRRFTDAGIGVALDQDKKPCVVILLAIWPRFVGGRAP